MHVERCGEEMIEGKRRRMEWSVEERRRGLQ